MEASHEHQALISRESIYNMLQEYTKKKDLIGGRHVQSLMRMKGLHSIAVLGNHLIRLFASCGSLREAEVAFREVSTPTVHTWNALISAHLQSADTQSAFKYCQGMRAACMKPDIVTYLYMLKACSVAGSLVQGWLVHDNLVRDAFESNITLVNTLVDMYAKFGVLEEAHALFQKSLKHTLVSWGALISGYSRHGQGLIAINLFEKMQEEGLPPDKVIYLGIVKACTSIGEIEQAKQLHCQIVRCGLDADLVMGNALVDMYAKLGLLEEAHNVFDGLLCQSVVPWSALIAGYAQHRSVSIAMKMYEKMEERGVRPDKITFLCILKACNGIINVAYVHEQIMSSELNLDVDLLNAVIEAYARCGSLDKALECFNTLQQPNAGSWDVLIGGYILQGDNYAALNTLSRMQEGGFKWSETSFSCALKMCALNGDITEGRVLHHEIIKHGLALNTSLGNALLDLYAKCGSLDEAHIVFDRIPNCNIVSWTVLISGYVLCGDGLSALGLFQKMHAEGLMYTKVTFCYAMKACGGIKALSEGKKIHEDIIRIGFDADVIVGSAIIDFYVKCKLLDEAQKVFDRLEHHDVVSWAAMVAGYVVNERSIPALHLFARMQEESVKPDQVVYLCVLKACGSVGVVKHGEIVHDQIIRDGLERDTTMANTVVDMYVKCGRFDSARRVFDGLPTQNVIAWGAMITGYAQLGNFEAVQLHLDEMQHAGVKPDDAIFTNILAACSHSGELEEGQRFFQLMKEHHGMTANAEQYSCMIDLLGRAGCFKEAADYLESYPGSPDFITWVSLLSSCRFHGNVMLGRLCFDEICKLNLVDASGHVLMSNTFVEAQLWEEVDRLQKLRKNAHAWKKPGIAWIEVDGFAHELVIGGDKHPQDLVIRAKLQSLNKAMKHSGHLSHLDSVMESMLDESRSMKWQPKEFREAKRSPLMSVLS